MQRRRCHLFEFVKTLGPPSVTVMSRTLAATPSHKSPSDEVGEDIEGLNDPGDDGLGDYPIDTLLIRTETRTVYDVLRRIDTGSVIMNPEFQRDFVWDREKQGRLIESVLMRIPLPVFYFAENKKGQIIVVDGLQRLSTLQAFLKGEERLTLPEQPTLNGKSFDELSVKLQNRIEDCQLQLYIIDSKVPERAKLDIFERVNNGEPLTRQQMRNCIYTGPATQFLKRQAHHELFLEATGGSLSKEKMRDREFVNRFCAFQLLSIDEYKKDMDGFLAKSLEQMNAMPAEALLQLEVQLQRGLQNNLLLFGRHAFRKHTPQQHNRSIINASLWDVMTTGLSRYPTDLVKQHQDTLKLAIYLLLDDAAFNASISYSPNSTNSVKTRFEMSRALFQEALGAHTD
jgi:hypothetical protein